METEAAAPSAEQEVVSNMFGTVTNKRVVYFRNKGWFSGGSRQDIPLKHVTSVRLDTSRSLVGGIILLLIGLGFLATSGGAKIIGIIIIAVAALFLWGSPTVVVNTSGNDLNAAKGFPWLRGEATAFVDALRKQLFHE
ncbi:MAG TPA: hypothetical protein VMV39_04810 [Terracidiphilus sp.]|nr:hypothetical protein [Terracidiphilus sp.]